MKKILLTIVLIICITGCSSNQFSKINYKDLSKKLDNKESFILLFNDDSNEGKLLKKTLNSALSDNNITAYEINSKKIKEDEKNALRPILSYKDVSIVFIKEGNDPSEISHITSELTTKEQIIDRLIDYEFIKTSK